MVNRCQTNSDFDRKITEDVRQYAAEQGLSEDEAIKQGTDAKLKEFAEKGPEIHAKA